MLAVTTDLNMVVRGAVAVLAGIVAAATVHTISSRRSPSDEH
ncbi:hypothetical protein [Microbacterium amylolyticum]|uniref:Uncharacterized protein n=1 Tax=Microbacterium amylolyticum TaxID=936337 RepID=A0ABS4ZHD0_9MICO|nr:hypothetical protein [Microbacterium amylolyticum]MBP2436607.1 hypothetical protein [Microbacterium amylolyticum]